MRETVMLDRKTFILGILSLSAVLLLAGNIVMPRRALADQLVKDRDYQAVTGSISSPGGDALYITDNHTGMMAIYIYDPNIKDLKLVGVKPVMDAFPNAGRRGR
jgi:hypothetical protein